MNWSGHDYALVIVWVLVTLGIRARTGKDIADSGMGATAVVIVLVGISKLLS